MLATTRSWRPTSDLTSRSQPRPGSAGATSAFTQSSATYPQRSSRTSTTVKGPLFSRLDTNSRGLHQTQSGSHQPRVAPIPPQGRRLQQL
jgi:hypothetical protein